MDVFVLVYVQSKIIEFKCFNLKEDIVCSKYNLFTLFIYYIQSASKIVSHHDLREQKSSIFKKIFAQTIDVLQKKYNDEQSINSFAFLDYRKGLVVQKLAKIPQIWWLLLCIFLSIFLGIFLSIFLGIFLCDFSVYLSMNLSLYFLSSCESFCLYFRVYYYIHIFKCISVYLLCSMKF